MAMEVDTQASSPAFDDFLQTGRTGRRNAMPDILGENAQVSTAQLPDTLQKLTCADIQLDPNCSSSSSNPGTSGEGSTTNT